MSAQLPVSLVRHAVASHRRHSSAIDSQNGEIGFERRRVLGVRQHLDQRACQTIARTAAYDRQVLLRLHPTVDHRKLDRPAAE
jgi:hypothetical protein